MSSQTWVGVVVVILFGASAFAEGESSGVLLEKGAYMEQTVGDLNGAVSVYQQIIDVAKANRPYVAQAYLRQGLCYLQLGRQQEGREALGKVIAEFPEETELVKKAREALGGNVSDADKRRAEELRQSGWSLWQARNLAEAEMMFRNSVSLDPGNADAWNGLGWSCQNQGKPAEAEDAFRKCLALESTHSAALNGLGWIAKAAGKTDEAIGYWKRAVDATPGATAALSGLASTHMEREKYDEAARFYQMWLDIEPGSAEAKVGLEKAARCSSDKTRRFHEAFGELFGAGSTPSGAKGQKTTAEARTGPDGTQYVDVSMGNWKLIGNDSLSYEVGVETQRLFNGNAPGYLKSISSEPKGFGTLMQQIDAKPYWGKRVRMRAQVKAENVEKWAGLWMRIDAQDRGCLGFDNMEQRPIKGTQDWAQYDVVLDVPSDSVRIAFGVVLDGRGEVLISGLRLELVGTDVPTTGTK